MKKHKLVRDHYIILIEDNLKFQQVVRLLDNPYFLEIRDFVRELLEKISNKELSSLLELVPQKYELDIVKCLSEFSYRYRDQVFLEKKSKQDILLYWKRDIIGKKFSYQQLNSLFAQTIAKIFRKPDHYANLVYFALLNDEIHDTNFTPVEFKIHHPHFSLPVTAQNNEKRIELKKYFDKEISNEAVRLFKPPLGVSLVMYLHPPFTLDEVKRAMETQLEELELSLQYHYSKEGYDIESFDVRPNIKRDRKWYLDNLSGKSYVQIATEEAAKYEGNSAAILGQITKAIQGYKKFISYDPKSKNRSEEHVNFYKKHHVKKSKIRLIPTIIPLETDPAKKSLYLKFSKDD